jgi:hypothetical protein
MEEAGNHLLKCFSRFKTGVIKEYHLFSSLRHIEVPLSITDVIRTTET